MTADAQALTVVSGSALYQAFLDRGGWSQRPGITGRLRRKGRRTSAMETTALRISAWSTSPYGQLAFGLDGQVPSVYGRQVVVAGEARAKDLPLLIELASRYIRDGCPENCMVQWTLEEGADWLAYSHYGGREAKRVREALQRLMTVVLQDVTVLAGGGDPIPLGHNYHFIEDAWIVGQGKGASWVRLHRTFAQLLRMGIVTFLDNPTLRKLQAKDEIAMRLWLFFESEGGPGRPAGWKYPVFPVADAPMPSISQMAWLSGNRQYVVRRLRTAMKNLCAIDPRYVASIDRKAWLHVRRKTDEMVPSGESADAAKTDEGIRSRRTRQYDQDGREHTKSRSPKRRSNVVGTSNVLASLDSLTGEEALYAVLKAKGWPRRSARQTAGIRAIAQRRKLGIDHDVAAIILNDHPGREHADVFGWLEQWRRPSRPVQLTIEEPTPLCDGANCEDRSRTTIVFRETRPYLALCESCQAEAA